jgi:hypothetical protein
MDAPGYQLGALEEQSGNDRSRTWFALATGFNLAIAVCYLTCKPLQTRTLSWPARLLTSAAYLLVASLIGALGTWSMLPRSSRRHFRPLALCGVRGWVFVPAIVLFLQYKSFWAPLIAIVSAALMAVCLYSSTDAMPKPAPETSRSQQYLQKNLFTSEVRLAPTSWVPFGLSLLLYSAALSAIAREIELLTLFLAAYTFLLVLQITAAQAEAKDPNNDIGRRSRSYSSIATAFCCVFIALSVSPRVWQDPLLAWKHSPSHPPPTKKQRPLRDHSSSGYRTIVLWPIQKKEKVVPSPHLNNASSRGTAKPWIIPFYGPYWYFKSLGESPGPNARTTRGDPLKVNVRSTDSGQLLMEAHQYLPDPIDMTCCREMQIVFRNDVSLGAFAVSISLTDSHSKSRLSQNLGVKFVAPSPADQTPDNTSPVEETLTFPFPKHGTIKKFDAITVVLLPDANHRTAGRKVAVEMFVMVPN